MARPHGSPLALPAILVVLWAGPARASDPPGLVSSPPGGEAASDAAVCSGTGATDALGVKVIGAAGVARCLSASNGRALVVDTRPATQFEEAHIPGAVNVPWTALERQGAGLLPADRATPLIFYCGGEGCDLSTRAASAARQAGYSDVSAFPGGEPAWRRSDRPLESTVAFARSGRAILLDLREPGEAARAHLPGAVGLPASRLAARRRDLIPFRTAPLILHGAPAEALAGAAEQLRDWDFTAVTTLAGGLAAWRAAGLPLEAGPLPTAIRWTRRLAPGEVAPEAFVRAVRARSAVIVDVRSPAEFARGHLPGALSLPLETFASRLGELPAGRAVYLYCASGSRAEAARAEAAAAGVPALALRAPVELDEVGHWSVGH